MATNILLSAVTFSFSFLTSESMLFFCHKSYKSCNGQTTAGAKTYKDQLTHQHVLLNKCEIYGDTSCSSVVSMCML